MIGGGLIGHALASGDRVLGNGLIASALCTKIPDDEPKVAPWIGRYCFDFTACFSQIQVTEIIISNKKYKAGLYNAQGKRIATWQESHINVNKHYTSSTCLTDKEAGTFNIVSRFPTTTKIVIPQFDYSLSSYVEIYDGAFNNQQHLRRLCLPDRLQYIDSGAFNNCFVLRDITYYSLDEGNFVDEWAYFPPTMQNFNTSCFANCQSIEHIVIPGPNVNTISNSAFANCNKLKTLQLPGDDNRYYFYIYAQAFVNCYELEELHLSSKLSYIYNQCWMNCYKLRVLTIAEGPTSIYQQAFYNCYKLQELVIPKSITYIDSAAFYNCNELHTLILPLRDCTEGRTMSIYQSVFHGCYKLNNLYLPERTYFNGGTFNGIGRDLPQVNVYMAADAYISASGMFGNNMGQNIVFNSAAASLQEAPNTYQSAFGDFYDADNAAFAWSWSDPHPIVHCGTLYFYFYRCFFDLDNNVFVREGAASSSVKLLIKDPDGNQIYITPKTNWISNYTLSNKKYGTYQYKILAVSGASSNDESKIGIWKEVELNASTVRVEEYFEQDFNFLKEKVIVETSAYTLGLPPDPVNRSPMENTYGGKYTVSEGTLSGNIAPGNEYRVFSIISLGNSQVIKIPHIHGYVSNNRFYSFGGQLGYTIADYVTGQSIQIAGRGLAGFAGVDISTKSTTRRTDDGSLITTSEGTKKNSVECDTGYLIFVKSASVSTVIDFSETEYPSAENGYLYKVRSKKHQELSVVEHSGNTIPQILLVETAHTVSEQNTEGYDYEEHKPSKNVNYAENSSISTMIVLTKLLSNWFNLTQLFSYYDRSTNSFSDIPTSQTNMYAYSESGYSITSGMWTNLLMAGYYLREMTGYSSYNPSYLNYPYSVLDYSLLPDLYDWHKSASTNKVIINGQQVSGAYFDNDSLEIVVPKYRAQTIYADDWESYYN